MRACLFLCDLNESAVSTRLPGNIRKTVQNKYNRERGKRGRPVISSAGEEERDRERKGEIERASGGRRYIYIYRGILLYTACIITLRCTCELFPPRLTRPIHNRMTAAKVLPVIAPRAPPRRPNIVRTPRFGVVPPPSFTPSHLRGERTYCPELRGREPSVRPARVYTFAASGAS